MRHERGKWVHLTEPGPRISGSESKFMFNGCDPELQDLMDDEPYLNLNIILVNFIISFNDITFFVALVGTHASTRSQGVRAHRSGRDRHI